MPGATSIPSKWDSILQRLFSTFPTGWPGAGLLLLRLCLGIPLILFGVADFFTWHVFAGIGAVFLIAGMWTPPTGILIAILESCSAWFLYRSRLPATGCIHFLRVYPLASLCSAQAPWSVDARLFGRKRFDVYGQEKSTSKELGMACYIKGYDRDRSRDDSIAEKPDNRN